MLPYPTLAELYKGCRRPSKMKRWTSELLRCSSSISGQIGHRCGCLFEALLSTKASASETRLRLMSGGLRRCCEGQAGTRLQHNRITLVRVLHDLIRDKL